MYNNKQAFTLIELLVVVLIIGILAAVALPQYQKAVLKSHLVSLKNLVKNITTAEEAYYLANNDYTTTFSDLDITPPEDADCRLENSQGGGSLIACQYKNIGYTQRFNYSKTRPLQRSCIAYNNDAVAIAVCQQETQQKTPYYDAGNGKSYQYTD